MRQPKHHLHSKKLMYSYYSMEKYVDTIVLNTVQQYIIQPVISVDFSYRPTLTYFTFFFNPDNC